MTILDVGQGDCLFVETPGGRTMLIDGGGAGNESQADASDVGERTVVPFLHHKAVNRVDVLMLTHPHGDHAGGLSAVLREETVGIALDGTVLPSPTPAYTEFRNLAQQKHIPYKRAARGMSLNLGDGVRADILNPPATGTPYGTNSDNATVNNYSLVLRLSYGQTHFLLDGDAQTEAEQAMEAAGENLRADVLKTGHHGADNATSDGWLDRVHPRFAVISCGARNTFGHPSPRTLARLAAHGVQIFRTDKNGAVTFVSDGRTVTARPYLSGR